MHYSSKIVWAILIIVGSVVSINLNIAFAANAAGVQVETKKSATSFEMITVPIKTVLPGSAKEPPVSNQLHFELEPGKEIALGAQGGVAPISCTLRGVGTLTLNTDKTKCTYKAPDTGGVGAVKIKDSDNPPQTLNVSIYSKVSSSECQDVKLVDTFQDLSFEHTEANDIAVSHSGEIFVVGGSYSTGPDGNRNSLIRKSVDGGKTWITINQLLGVQYDVIAINNSNNTIFVGASRGFGSERRWVVRKGLDGGKSWQTVDVFTNPSSPDSLDLMSIGFDSNNNAYVAGNQGGVYTVRKSTNNGGNWTTILTTAYNEDTPISVGLGLWLSGFKSNRNPHLFSDKDDQGRFVTGQGKSWKIKSYDRYGLFYYSTIFSNDSLNRTFAFGGDVGTKNFLIRYKKGESSPVILHQSETSEFTINAITMDNLKNLYAVGYGPQESHKWLVKKFCAGSFK